MLEDASVASSKTGMLDTAIIPSTANFGSCEKKV